MVKLLIFCLSLFSIVCLVGQAAPDFEYETPESLSATLSDLQGKVVYVSFWASWCGPCKKNFQKYYTLREELAAEGVVLLNISVDKDKAKWVAALDKHSFLNGINGHALNLAEVNAAYQISKVPDYHIINKRGEFVYLSDKPNRNIVEEFKQWLEE